MFKYLIKRLIYSLMGRKHRPQHHYSSSAYKHRYPHNYPPQQHYGHKRYKRRYSSYSS
ncbi:hypothetical protein K0T92_14850 [Paenibacillus oenotherae]|uniref:Uncharacterized protein n=1 Tax=Paenibacillus oenotherae TaxID=1435645 RepID=A0ABS7D918_9BACL|nr:hypothetical protein [Paenibacillus oenotherae]MBW7476022.1 hypothetical protein [Paenibacillus oenotherae]